MSRESSLWKWLKVVEFMLDGHLHMRRIENMVAEGDPDVEGCLNGRCFNIELKSADRPARGDTRILGPSHIRPRQIPWARARWKAGGSSFFLIQVGSGNLASRYLIPGDVAHKIVGSDEAELMALSCIEPLASQFKVVSTAASFRFSGET